MARDTCFNPSYTDKTRVRKGSVVLLHFDIRWNLFGWFDFLPCHSLNWAGYVIRIFTCQFSNWSLCGSAWRWDPVCQIKRESAACANCQPTTKKDQEVSLIINNNHPTLSPTSMDSIRAKQRVIWKIIQPHEHYVQYNRCLRTYVHVYSERTLLV